MGEAPGKKRLVSLAALLRQPRVLELGDVQRAVEFALHGAPQAPQVIPLKKAPGFGVVAGPIRLGILNVGHPYFPDIATTADRLTNFAARLAVQQHQAWLSVDLVGDPPGKFESVYPLLGALLAEFLGDDVLGLIRLPDGPIIGYDFSFVPMLRNGKAAEVFDRGAPDRVFKATGKDAELAAATEEARRRWPEFLAAFANRRPEQGFAVKKKFVDGADIEHMWVSITSIEASALQGWLSNTPGIIRSLKLRDPVVMEAGEIEDWIYTNGAQNVGGFQTKVMRQGDGGKDETAADRSE